MCREERVRAVGRFLMELSNELHLQYEQQDWGFVNADPQRLEEFISFFFRRVPDVEQSFEGPFLWGMTELIIESADLYFEAGTTRPEIDAEIRRFWNFIRGRDVADYYLQDIRRCAGSDEPHGSRELLNFLESL